MTNKAQRYATKDSKMNTSIHAPCPQSRAVKAYLDAGDRAESRASAIEGVSDTLRTTLNIAIAAGKGYVPFAAVVAGRDVVKLEHVAETVSDALGYDDVLALVMNALAHSECVLVAALRDRIVARVVEARAADLAWFDE